MNVKRAMRGRLIERFLKVVDHVIVKAWYERLNSFTLLRTSGSIVASALHARLNT